MQLRQLTENLGSIFGKGSDMGKIYNPGQDDEIAAKKNAEISPQPTNSIQAADWNKKFGATHNPDGSPKNPAADAAAPASAAPASAGVAGTGSVSYVGGFKNKTRNKPIVPALMKALNSAANIAGVRVVIFSGGQDAKGQGTRRTGSTRHDGGYAADVYVYDAKGKQLNTQGNDPLMLKFIAACKQSGIKGMGAHPGYMNGKGVHVDLWGAKKGSAMWGAGGTGSPPTTIARAFSTGRSVA